MAAPKLLALSPGMMSGVQDDQWVIVKYKSRDDMRYDQESRIGERIHFISTIVFGVSGTAYHVRARAKSIEHLPNAMLQYECVAMMRIESGYSIEEIPQDEVYWQCPT